MQRKIATVLLLLFPFGLCCIAGCGAPTYSVSGVVRANGQPLSNVKVSLIASDGRLAAIAPVDAEGRFAMSAVPAGTHTAILLAERGAGPPAGTGGLDPAASPAAMPAGTPPARRPADSANERPFDPKYSAAGTSPLVYEIGPGSSNELTIEVE